MYARQRMDLTGNGHRVVIIMKIKVYVNSERDPLSTIDESIKTRIKKI